MRRHVCGAREEVARLRAEVVRLRRALAAERDAADHDVLTGLLNRRGFYHRAGRVLAGPAGQPVCVLMLDLDGFKQVNDAHGHRAGDQVLVTVANRLATHLGLRWWCARLGGDELAALHTGPLLRPVAVAETLAGLVASPVRASGYDVRVGAAIGVAAATMPVALGDLLGRADTAMYRAKCQGRPVLWTPTHDDVAPSRALLRTRDLPVPAVDDPFPVGV
jgi:diguanylate cyclase (GGDEF)-like protein